MRAAEVLSYRPVLGESHRLRRDILGDVSVSRKAGALKTLFAELRGFLQRVRKNTLAKPQLLERQGGQHSLYLWREDLVGIWEGRKSL